LGNRKATLHVGTSEASDVGFLMYVAGALDEPLMTSTVRNIVAKKKVTVPSYDFMTHCR